MTIGMMRASVAVLLAVVVTLAPSCRRDELSGPPDLRLGRDECVECGMLINEDRCSTAFLIVRGGRREYVMFDDIGCMLDYEAKERADAAIVEGYVRDHGTRAWIAHTRAAYLVTDPDRLPTPMGSGMVAFAAKADAERARAEFGGTVMEYGGLPEARRAWAEARRAKKQGEAAGTTTP